jgi:hypothetical protein
MPKHSQHFEIKPTIVISADGSTALEIVEYLGKDPHANRDATYLGFRVRTEGTEETRLVYVLVDGYLLRIPEAIPTRLRTMPNAERNVLYLAEACLGEYLGEVGLPEFGAAGDTIPSITLESTRIQRWAEMKRVTDEEIEAYIRRKCLWAWRFNHPEVQIYEPDFIRFGTDTQNVGRLIEFGRDVEWTIEASTPFGFRIAGTEKMLRRERTEKPAKPHASQAETHHKETSYVDQSRIAQLEGISSPFDLSKLVALCKELNTCWRGSAVHAVAALVRSVIDHVPPIFSAKTFAEVANNSPGSRSFKDSMRHLEASARKIADAHLHTQIRKSEVLPTRTQVDFSRDLDVLLAEIVRVLK